VGRPRGSPRGPHRDAPGGADTPCQTHSPNALRGNTVRTSSPGLPSWCSPRRAAAMRPPPRSSMASSPCTASSWTSTRWRHALRRASIFHPPRTFHRATGAPTARRASASATCRACCSPSACSAKPAVTRGSGAWSPPLTTSGATARTRGFRIWRSYSRTSKPPGCCPPAPRPRTSPAQPSTSPPGSPVRRSWPWA